MDGIAKEREKLFDDLCQIEPRLKQLKWLCWRIRLDDPMNGMAAWYGYGKYSGRGIKQRMSKLVGWDAETDDERLTSSEAYDEAYHYLYSILTKRAGR